MRPPVALGQGLVNLPLGGRRQASKAQRVEARNILWHRTAHQGRRRLLVPAPCEPPSKASTPPVTNNNTPAPASAASPAGGISQVIESLEQEDDLSPLLSALNKAQERAESLAIIREANEAEALNIAAVAIAAKETLSQAQAGVESTLAHIRKREEQVRKMEAQKEQIEAEQDRLRGDLETDALVSMDRLPEQDAASVGDWDIDAIKSGQESVDNLSSEEKVITELKAAGMIIAERIEAYTAELAAAQARLEGLNERVVAAEQQYLKADSAAAAAMRATEKAMKDELEAHAVSMQIKSAVDAAAKSLQSLHELDADEEVLAALAQETLGEKAADKQKSVTEVAQEELAKIESEPMLDEDAVAAAAAPFPVGKLAAAAALVVGAIAACVLTPLGAWLTQEVSLVSVAASKLSALCAALMDKIPWPQPHHGEEGLWETIAILFTSVIAVPTVMKFVPGGSAVLGFLIGGAVIGPHGLSVITNLEPVRHLAEMGVVFLLFNIGLELSLERLQAMAKAVFGMGSLQFVLSTLAIGGAAAAIAGYSGPTAVIVGGALALSSTAVAMQVLQDRSETGTRHGRATFAVLLLQDLAVVVLLMLVPLLAQGSGGGIGPILKALGVAAVKGALCITGIIIAGRTLLRPVFRRIASLANAEIFAATTLLVVLGSSVLTQIAGLSLALGAFLAGLLMAETEYVMQVESDIAPYKGLLMGLFFISVGMEISLGVLFNNWPLVLGSLLAMVVGKTAIMALIGQPFGLSKLSAVRSGLYIAPGGEFAFVVLNEAVAAGLLPASDIPTIFFMVVLSMAITPYLASLGGAIGKTFESKDVTSLQPSESETAEMKDHVVIMGFGRVGQTIAQLLSERLIPFVALDVRSDRVQAGKAADLPVYFGDAGSPAVLHHVGAGRARCAVITLDTPGANYRAVWAMNKHFPNAKIYVRAHDVEHGLNLEKAGATAVVPEILEPSLQLAAAVLSSMNLKSEEIAEVVESFRRSHMSELSKLSLMSGGSLGYGFKELRSPEEALAAGGDDAGDLIMAKPAPA